MRWSVLVPGGMVMSLMAAPPTPVHSDDLKPKVGITNAIARIGAARFTALTPRLIRLEYDPSGEFEDRPSLAFNRRTSDATATWSATIDGDDHLLDTGRLILRYSPDGKPFHDGNLTIRSKGDIGGISFEWRPGMPATGNLRGTTRTLDGVNGATELGEGILSRDGWAVVDDSASPLLEDRNGRPGFAPRRDPNHAMDLFFFGYGHDYKGALADFTLVAGKIPLPPRYVFGSWWSRYWAYSDAELRELVNDFRGHDVPLDVLVIDMDWHLDGWTGYTWNPRYFPDPEGFLRWCHAQGLKVTLNLHPAEGVGRQEKAFPDVCKAMGLDPESTERISFDCTDPNYMSAYFKLLHHPLEKMGIDFWWMDWQQGTETKIRNLDPLMALNYLHWRDMEDRAADTGKRPIIFSRWGGLGNHRYQIGFSGDTFCNWPSLAFQPWFTATAGNVGYAYWSHDIGGHQPGPVDPELYVRWLQWGALSPILRTHTTKNSLAERRIWKFPPAYFEAARKAYRLRYELIPYVYSMARKCHDTGLPICRPLYYEWPELDEAYARKNEYLFGDDLLVSPVVEPADPISGCAMVEVWLPPGKWVNWFTGRQYEGPTTARLVVPLDEIPLFARAGAIIPTSHGSRREISANVSRLTLQVFPGANGKTTLYEDDAESNGYLTEQRSMTLISIHDQDTNVLIEIEPRTGRYDKAPDFRFWDIVLHSTSPARAVTLNGDPLPRYRFQPRGGQNACYYSDAETANVISLPIQKADAVIRIVATFDDRGSAPQLIREGLLGRWNMIRRAAAESVAGKEQLPKLHATVASIAALDSTWENWTEKHEAILVSWPDLIKEAADSPVDESLKRRVLSILTGLYHQLHVTRGTGAAAALDCRVTGDSLAPFPTPQPCRMRVELTTDPRIVEKNETSCPWTSLESSPLIFRRTIAMGASPESLVLKSNLKFSCGETEFIHSRDVVILPSINDWQILGPFDLAFAKSFDTRLPPDESIDLAAEYDGKGDRKIKWQRVERRITPESNLTDEFFVDFDDVFGGRVQEAVAYALTFLDAPEDMDAVLALGTDDGVLVRLNGDEVFRVNVGRPYTSKQDRVPVKLKKGENVLLLKINQGGGDWGLCVHVETPDGKPLTQVKARAAPATP